MTGSMFEVINRRQSIRSYSGERIEPEKIERISQLLTTHNRGPFGQTARFELLDLYKHPIGIWPGNTATYGIIRGAKYFILGAAKEAERAGEDFGYCMEKIILGITDLGLGTCWLGGTFRRKEYASLMNLAADEHLPAITPVGYIGSQTIIDKSAVYLARARKRKPWERRFFLHDFSMPLPENEAGDYRDMLLAVQWGPSSSNLQPWRVLKERERNKFHFYVAEKSGYLGNKGKIKLQRVDMGIAMCQFETVAVERGKDGRWLVEDPSIESCDMQYIVTWIES